MVRLEDFVMMRNMEYRGLNRIWHDTNFNFSRSTKNAMAFATVTVPTAKFLCFPIDRLMNCGKSSLYSDVGKTALNIFKRTDVFSSYPALFRTIPQTVLTFGLVNGFHDGMTDLNESATSKVTKTFLAGSWAGFFSTAIFYPFEAAHKFLIVDEGRKNRSPGILKSFDYRYIEGGYKALYRGYTLNLMSSSLYRSCYFGGYEYMKYRYEVDPGKHSFLQVYPYALASTVMSIALTHPLDVFRMNYLAASYKNLYEFNRIGIYDFTYRTITFKSLFSGLHWNLGKSFSGALILVLFDRQVANPSNFFKFFFLEPSVIDN